MFCADFRSLPTESFSPEQHSMALIDKMYPELAHVDLGFVYTGVGRQARDNQTVRNDFEMSEMLAY